MLENAHRLNAVVPEHEHIPDWRRYLVEFSGKEINEFLFFLFLKKQSINLFATTACRLHERASLS